MSLDVNEDLKKKINFDPAFLYYSTPKENSNDVIKTPVLNVETYNSSNRKHICVICGKRFFTKNSLETHMAHHPTDKPVTANLEKDENTDWKNRFVKNKGISCTKANCNFIALDAVEYCQHTATCEGIRFTMETSSAYCESCDCYYSSENYFKAHSILQHPENGPNISLQDGVAMNNTKISDPVSLYVSENSSDQEKNTKTSSSHSMYPDSIVTKKKFKNPDAEILSLSILEGTLTKMTNGTGISNSKSDNTNNLSGESSINEVVEISNSPVTANIQTLEEKSSEIGLENRTQIPLIDSSINIEHTNNSDGIVVAVSVHDEVQSLVDGKSIVCSQQNLTRNICSNISEEGKSSSQLIGETTKAVNLPTAVTEKGVEKVDDAKNEVNRNVSLQVENEICNILASAEQMKLTDSANLFEGNGSSLETSKKVDQILENNDEDVISELTEKVDVAVSLSDENYLYLKIDDLGKIPEMDRESLLKDVKHSFPLSSSAIATEESFSVATELDVHQNTVDQPLLVSENVSKIQPSLPLSTIEQSVEVDKCMNHPKNGKNSEKVVTIENKIEPDIKLESSPRKKGSCLTTSDEFPKMKYSKSCSKKIGNCLKMKKPNVTHSTPNSRMQSSENNENDNVFRVRKSQLVAQNSDDLNIKQRSVRQRKKLILPDFEYGIDLKAEFSDSSATENSFPFSSSDGELAVKKRGRPRKKPTESSSSKIPQLKKKVSSTVPSNINDALPVNKTSLNLIENEEQIEEFSLNTTINESECDTGFNDSYCADISLNDSKIEEIIHEEDDDPNDDIHSWLKKVDFSEHTSFTSWCEKPSRKKLGRPPKKKKLIEALNNVSNPSSNTVIIKRKKGRPSLKDKPTVIPQIQKSEEILVNNSKVERSGENLSPDVSPKKRGRPCKIKSDGTSDSNSVQSYGSNDKLENNYCGQETKLVATTKAANEVETVMDSKSDGSDVSKTENVSKSEGTPSQIIVVRKRGRPRKSITDVQNIESKKTLDVGQESGDINDALRADNTPMNQFSLSPPDSSGIEMKSIKTDLTGTSSTNLHVKKRGRPLKKRTFFLKKREMHAPNQSPRPTEEINEEKGASSECDMMLPVVKQESRSSDLDQESDRAKPKLLKKKISAQHVHVVEKPVPDETIKIDEALYHADLRNKSKFSRVFKKSVVMIDDDTADNVVVCGRCQKKMTMRHYLKYHKLSHYYLCWLEDEPEINLKDDAEISRILQSWVNPDALRKKAIRLSCELCDKVMKSVIGYVSHIRFCQKKDEDELLEKCTLCPRALKPSSIRHHYVKFHGVNKFTTTSDSKLIPVACTETKRESINRPNEDSTLNAIRNVQMKYERLPVEKVDILNDDHFWKSLKTSYDLYMCMGLSCRHMTLGKDDLKSHILSCSASFCEFTCSSCPYTTKYESEIIYHSKNKCKETSDSEDNAEEKSQLLPDRRVSTRVKKRKYVFDYDDCIDVSHKRKYKDDDFKPTGDDSANDSNASDEEEPREKRSRFSKRKSEILLNKAVEESGLRQAFLYHPSTRVFDPLGWTVDVRLKTFSTYPVLMDLRVDINEWETFPISDFLKHSPLQHKSPKVTFDGSPLVEMNLFDSDMIKGVPVCYTGGPVWSMAWAPLPAHVAEQYLAVAGLQHMNHLVDLSAPVEFASFIQIWKFGSLDNISNDIHAPTLAWAIAHNFGAVWSMEWCPSGGFDNSSTPYRLGVLALATSAGCGVIYSMPRLDCGGETRSIVANPDPDLILKVRCDDVQCTRIVWKRHNLPDTIFGGFSNGTIAMWNVSSISSILKKGKTLYPYRTFEAHNASITALDVHWLDNCRFMVTSSSDRIFKYWDLEDLSGPMYEYEVTNQAVSAVWMHHWIVTASGLDFVNHGEATAFILHPRDLLERKKPVINIKETFWSVAYSDWNDTVAFASNGGCVTVYAARHMSTLTYKIPDFEKIVTQTGLVPLTEEEKSHSESLKSDTGLPSTNDSFDCSSVIKNNGIKFCDRLKDKPNTDSLNFTVDEGNVRSVNKVCWNQNYNSFNWLAVGYECGFVRVIRVERFDKSHLTKFYKMNENSTITLI